MEEVVRDVGVGFPCFGCTLLVHDAGRQFQGRVVLGIGRYSSLTLNFVGVKLGYKVIRSKRLRMNDNRWTIDAAERQGSRDAFSGTAKTWFAVQGEPGSSERHTFQGQGYCLLNSVRSPADSSYLDPSKVTRARSHGTYVRLRQKLALIFDRTAILKDTSCVQGPGSAPGWFDTQHRHLPKPPWPPFPLNNTQTTERHPMHERFPACHYHCRTQSRIGPPQVVELTHVNYSPGQN